MDTKAELLADLDQLREGIESGDIVALGYVTVRTGDYIGTGWVQPGPVRHQLVAGTAYLQSRLIEDARKEQMSVRANQTLQ